MKVYINQLNAHAKEEQARREAALEAQANAAAAATRGKLVALDERVARLLASIPLEVQGEGLSILALQARLRARGRGHSRCHVGELGEAMRRLGFRRRRGWRRGATGFKALWFPR